MRGTLVRLLWHAAAAGLKPLRLPRAQMEVHVHLKNTFPGGIGNRRITSGYNLWFASHPSSGPISQSVRPEVSSSRSPPFFLSFVRHRTSAYPYLCTPSPCGPKLEFWTHSRTLFNFPHLQIVRPNDYQDECDFPSQSYINKLIYTYIYTGTIYMHIQYIHLYTWLICIHMLIHAHTTSSSSSFNSSVHHWLSVFSRCGSCLFRNCNQGW